MTSWILRGVGAALIAVLATASMAQQSSNRVASSADWSVFMENSPKECWGVSSPKQMRNTRNGQPVEVRRGDVLLFVTFRPGTGARGEISFTGGYPFADGSNVEVRIGSETYQLFTDGDWAWPANAEDDAKILAAMRRGSEAVLTGRSGRGTQTQDTFSLMGFTAAMTEAENRCKS